MALTGEDVAGEGAAGDTAGSGAPVGADTSGSHTDLPGFNSLPGFGPAVALTGRRPASRRARLRHLLPRAHWAIWAAAVVLLLAAGTGLGTLLRGSDTLGPTAPAAAAVREPAAIRHTAGLRQPALRGRPDGLHRPRQRLPPGRPVTISLAGVGPSPDRPVTDRQGTFSYAIDQGHHFFRGPIPLGKYTAVVTAPGERSASVRFQVGAGPSTGPPPGQPPAP